MDFTQWIVFIITVRETLGKYNFRGCLKENTYGHPYLEFFPVELLSKTPPEGRGPQDSNKHHYIEFYVKSKSNARIFVGESKTKGFEIILGSRNNTSSQIRFITETTKRSMLTQTEGIVSEKEHRGFWVECDSHGVVMFGTLNSSEPILKWRFSNPIEIKIVSFSTWANVMGEWHFACSNTSVPGIEDEDRKLTANQRLRSDLLSYYIPSNFPRKSEELTENVELYLETNYFHMDEKCGQLRISGRTHLKWKDWKLSWNQTDYDGINLIHVTPSEIWTPNIYVMNSVAFEKKSLVARRTKVVIRNDGIVTWRTNFHSATYCILGFENWPFDTHKCSLKFGFLTEPNGIDFKSMVLPKVYVSKWELQSVNSTQTDNYCIIQIHFQRMDEPAIRILMIPSFLSAAALSLLSFMISPNSRAKLVLNCLSLFMLILVAISVADNLPLAISPMPKIVHLYSWSIIVMCIPILLLIALRYIPSNIILPTFLLELSRSITQILCFFPVASQIRPGIEENVGNSVHLCILVERLAFFIYFTVLVIPFMMNFSVLQKFI